MPRLSAVGISGLQVGEDVKSLYGVILPKKFLEYNDMYHQEMSAAAQTLYANLAQAARMQDMQRNMAHLPGGFVSKIVRQKTYWYYQFKLPEGKPQQIYVGPDDEATKALIQEKTKGVAVQSARHLVNLCESAVAMGVYQPVNKHARVLVRLAVHGFFHAGGILVGTHAFLAYQNMLGIRWSDGNQTVDLDFAHPGKNLSIALNPDFRMNTHEAVESLKMGFLPVNEGTRYVKQDEPDFDLDFLTCTHRGQFTPVSLPNMNVVLQPLRFMEFSMESPSTSVLPTQSGPILVNVPSPSRYALAKLLLYPVRLESHEPEKAKKDLWQAASLIEYLADQQPFQLQEAWSDLRRRGGAWRSHVDLGLQALHKLYPELSTQVLECDLCDNESETKSFNPAG